MLSLKISLPVVRGVDASRMDDDLREASLVFREHTGGSEYAKTNFKTVSPVAQALEIVLTWRRETCEQKEPAGKLGGTFPRTKCWRSELPNPFWLYRGCRVRRTARHRYCCSDFADRGSDEG
jgi:hypothetical protein